MVDLLMFLVPIIIIIIIFATTSCQSKHDRRIDKIANEILKRYINISLKTDDKNMVLKAIYLCMLENLYIHQDSNTHSLKLGISDIFLAEEIKLYNVSVDELKKMWSHERKDILDTVNLKN